jgi:hypothetical protein
MVNSYYNTFICDNTNHILMKNNICSDCNSMLCKECRNCHRFHCDSEKICKTEIISLITDTE